MNVSVKGGSPVKTLIRYAVLLVFSAALLGGCTPTKVSEVGERPDEPAIPEAQSKLLREILEYQKKSGRDMAQMLNDLKAQKAAEEAAKGPHPLVRDLAVARQLAAEAQETDDAKHLASLLHRIQFTLMTMLAEAPAGTIVKRLERARLALTLEQPSADDLSRAAKELMAALDGNLGVEPAELVPAVLTKLDAAKQKLDDGDAKGARRRIIEAQEQAASHQLNLVLRKALAAAKGAEEALNRSADLVVKAELEELAAMLDKVAAVAVVKTAEPEAETEALEEPAEEVEAAEEVPVPAREEPEQEPEPEAEEAVETPRPATR